MNEPVFILFLSCVKLQLYLSNLRFATALSDNPLLTYESLYSDGVNAYLENDWGNCVRYLELALSDYHWFKKNIARCRKQCYEEADTDDQIFSSAYQYDRIFEKTVINTLCMVKCKEEKFGSRPKKYGLSQADIDFENRKPYDYLQLCYFKMGNMLDAASAAATVLSVQPDHENMQQNLRYYVDTGGLNVEDIVNMEVMEYGQEYIDGDLAYQDENYDKAISHFEKSLPLFWDALDECRLLCEDPFNQGWNPDFVASVANHYTFTLRCKKKCPDKLANLYGEPMDDFVASVFNYLQFSYFKVGNIKKACESVESYLALLPDDSSQLRNKQFLWSTDGVKEEYFTPRSDVLSFKDRSDRENKLIAFIENSFVFVKNEKLETLKPANISYTENTLEPSPVTLPSISDTLLEIAELLGALGVSEPSQGYSDDKEDAVVSGNPVPSADSSFSTTAEGELPAKEEL